jgi:hypothetical protein
LSRHDAHAAVPAGRGSGAAKAKDADRFRWDWLGLRWVVLGYVGLGFPGGGRRAGVACCWTPGAYGRSRSGEFGLVRALSVCARTPILPSHRRCGVEKERWENTARAPPATQPHTATRGHVRGEGSPKVTSRHTDKVPTDNIDAHGWEPGLRVLICVHRGDLWAIALPPQVQEGFRQETAGSRVALRCLGPGHGVPR